MLPSCNNMGLAALAAVLMAGCTVAEPQGTTVVGKRGPAPSGTGGSVDVQPTGGLDAGSAPEAAQVAPDLGTQLGPEAKTPGQTPDAEPAPGPDALVLLDSVAPPGPDTSTPDRGTDLQATPEAGVEANPMAPDTGVARDSVPTSVTPPPGCPPAQPTPQGLGLNCTKGGGECHAWGLSAGIGGTACACDDWYTCADPACRKQVALSAPRGMPCMCILSSMPSNVFCGDQPDPGKGYIYLVGGVTVGYTVAESLNPALVSKACVPSACAGLDFSR